MCNGRFAILPSLLFAVLGCTGSAIPPGESVFQHDVTGEALPWTDENFDAADDKFTFAVFSDLTGGERERVFEIAVAQLSLLRPELIINVGDLIEGGSPDVGELAKQWDSFDKRANRATAPVFYVGGNHDLTGEVLQGVWDARYGRRYYHFVYRNVLFLVLDTEDNTPERAQEIHEAREEAIAILKSEGWDAFNQTRYVSMPEQKAGNILAGQSAYFQQVVVDNPGVRWTFLFMHKPAWERDGEEYFAAVEKALVDRPYTVFHGHVQAYGYLERFGRDYIRLATTGGSQITDGDRSMDHVTLVTVDENGVDIANLLLSGILDKTGHVPLDGDDVCFELAACPDSQ